MATTTTLSGKIHIGSDTDGTDIPIKTKLPPDKPGEFAFSYKADDITKAPKFNVGSFMTWAANQLGAGGTVDQLPDALKTFTLGVLTLDFSTKGNFDIKVELGKTESGNWNSVWKPISGLNFSIS